MSVSVIWDPNEPFLCVLNLPLLIDQSKGHHHYWNIYVMNDEREIADETCAWSVPPQYETPTRLHLEHSTNTTLASNCVVVRQDWMTKKQLKPRGSVALSPTNIKAPLCLWSIPHSPVISLRFICLTCPTVLVYLPATSFSQLATAPMQKDDFKWTDFPYGLLNF